MKKSELRNIIREELQTVLKENVNSKDDELMKKIVDKLAQKWNVPTHDAVRFMLQSLKRLGYKTF